MVAVVLMWRERLRNQASPSLDARLIRNPMVDVGMSHECDAAQHDPDHERGTFSSYHLLPVNQGHALSISCLLF